MSRPQSVPPRAPRRRRRGLEWGHFKKLFKIQTEYTKPRQTIQSFQTEYCLWHCPLHSMSQQPASLIKVLSSKILCHAVPCPSSQHPSSRSCHQRSFVAQVVAKPRAIEGNGWAKECKGDFYTKCKCKRSTKRKGKPATASGKCNICNVVTHRCRAHCKWMIPTVEVQPYSNISMSVLAQGSNGYAWPTICFSCFHIVWHSFTFTSPLPTWLPRGM